MTRAEYTKRAQKAYYDRLRADPIKWRAHLDRCNSYQKKRNEKKKQELIKLKEEKEKQIKNHEFSLEDKKKELMDLIEKGLIKIEDSKIIIV